MNNNNLASLYDLFFNSYEDESFYQSFIENDGQPALEIGSGTGRLLLRYLEKNLQVDGIEPNKDMIEICMQKAAAKKLNPKIFLQKLQNLSLNKKYKTIYMPLFVFQNIVNREEAIQALKLTYDYLEKNGQILITLFIPWNDPTGTWENTWRIRSIANYENLALLSESLTFDKFEQIQTKTLKYEIFKNDILEQTYLTNVQFRCYSRYELVMMLENSGFKEIEIFGDYLMQANSENSTYIFKAKK